MNAVSKTYVFLAALVALGIHIFFGWQFSVIGAILAGSRVMDKPVLAGVVTLWLSWGGLLAYNFIVAGPESIRMIRVLATLFGDIPSFVVVFLTMGIATILGSIGGWLGAIPLKATRKTAAN